MDPTPSCSVNVGVPQWLLCQAIVADEPYSGTVKQRLDAESQEIFKPSQCRLGNPKITRALIARGWRVSRNRVARRLRHLGDALDRAAPIPGDDGLPAPVSGWRRIVCSALVP